MSPQLLSCDYLVIGAGAMGLAFTDQLLSSSTSISVILVDKRAAAGGHWVDSYEFVTLHQPAAFYGVNSMVMNGGEGGLASKPEILAYYGKVVEKWKKIGRLQFLPQVEWKGEGRLISCLDSALEYQVKVKEVT